MKNEKNAFILYNYNKFTNDFEYIQEYYNINELIKDNNIQLNNKRSIYHYIKKEIGDIKESNTLTTCLLNIKEILKEQGAI